MAHTSEQSTELCIICADDKEIFSIGPCGHRVVCGECTLRARHLHNDFKCPMCRQSQPSVILSRSASKKFTDFETEDMPFNLSVYGMYFETKTTLQLYKQYMSLRCPLCVRAGFGVHANDKAKSRASRVFSSRSGLKQHVSQEHKMFLCDCCVSERNIFPFEQMTYTSKDLKRHMREGDLALPPSTLYPNGINGIEAHPYCEFCLPRKKNNKSYLGVNGKDVFFNQELLEVHMKSHHQKCETCVLMGHDMQFFRNVASLVRHYKKDHYVCPHKECQEAIHVVFRSEFDLRKHLFSSHGDKDARSLTSLLYQPQPSSRRSHQNNRRNTRNYNYNNHNNNHNNNNNHRSRTSGSTLHFSENTSNNNSIPNNSSQVNSTQNSRNSTQNSQNIVHRIAPLSKEEMEQRSALLEKRIKHIMSISGVEHVNEKYSDFRSLSQKVVRGDISAKQYVDEFLEWFLYVPQITINVTKEQWDDDILDVFKELVALIPLRFKATSEAMRTAMSARKKISMDVINRKNNPSQNHINESKTNNYSTNITNTTNMGHRLQQVYTRDISHNEHINPVITSSTEHFPSLPCVKDPALSAELAKREQDASEAKANANAKWVASHSKKGPQSKEEKTIAAAETISSIEIVVDSAIIEANFQLERLYSNEKSRDDPFSSIPIYTLKKRIRSQRNAWMMLRPPKELGLAKTVVYNWNSSIKQAEDEHKEMIENESEGFSKVQLTAHFKLLFSTFPMQELFRLFSFIKLAQEEIILRRKKCMFSSLI